MEIIRAVWKSRAGPKNGYSGVVWTGEDVVAMEPSRLRVVNEQFSPGARTAWRRDPYGQMLHVVYGVGRVRRRGGPVIEVRAGDTVVAYAGEWHWYGAAPNSFVAMVSAREAGNDDAEWGAHVSDAEYLLAPRTASIPRQDLDRTVEREACW
ncbi:cupin domain-containing protein [Dactylosporangium sp. NPDC000555]|uniref:cupin domain-containing protein n=1 Tax=Dactylosporangium sp. NPDC000555 TaxID=3154260 RepID=UPI003331D6F4